MIITETENLILREFDTSASEGLFTHLFQPGDYAFLGKGPGPEVSGKISGVTSIVITGRTVSGCGSMLKSEDRLIGRCGIRGRKSTGRTRPEISYLIDRDYCGGAWLPRPRKALWTSPPVNTASII